MSVAWLEEAPVGLAVVFFRRAVGFFVLVPAPDAFVAVLDVLFLLPSPAVVELAAMVSVNCLA